MSNFFLWLLLSITPNLVAQSDNDHLLAFVVSGVWKFRQEVTGEVSVYALISETLAEYVTEII